MHLEEQFAVVVSHEEGLPIVRLNGEMDLAAAPTMRDALCALVDAGNRELVLDLSEVTFMDSTALGVIAEIVRSGAWVTIAAASKPAQRVLDLSGLSKLCNRPAVDDLAAT